MAANELGYTTLSVAEPRRGVSVGATSCRARSVTEDNVPLGRARAKVPSAACQPQLCGVALLYSSFFCSRRRRGDSGNLPQSLLKPLCMVSIAFTIVAVGTSHQSIVLVTL